MTNSRVGNRYQRLQFALTKVQLILNGQTFHSTIALVGAVSLCFDPTSIKIIPKKFRVTISFFYLCTTKLELTFSDCHTLCNKMYH